MASHALLADAGVWIVDPTEGEGIEERIRALGEPAGVLQLLDRHNRACAAYAERLGVPHHRVPFDGVGPFETVPIVRRKRWQEVALWWPERRVLVTADALGTVAHYFTLGGERLGVHPLLRLTPPRQLATPRPGARPLRARRGRARTRDRGSARRARQLAPAAATPRARATPGTRRALTTIESVLSLFPETAAVEGGELSVGGIRASDLAAEFGTPLVVYCERTILDAARAYREAAPKALPLYSLKAFPNVELLRLLAAEGFGADVSTLGELEFARRAGIPGERIVVHGNNKSDEELRAAAEADVRFVVLDALDEAERAAAAGVRRALVRVTPGIDADTHEKIRTAHHGSKFGLPPADALAAAAAGRAAGLEVAGVHLHIGSQLVDPRAGLETIDWLKDFAAREWLPEVVDLGGGLGIPLRRGRATAGDPRVRRLAARPARRRLARRACRS